MEQKELTKGQDKLNNFLSLEITELFEKVLDFAEVAIPSAETYKRFRSKVLRIGNNAIRNTSKEVGKNYDVVWNPTVEVEEE